MLYSPQDEALYKSRAWCVNNAGYYTGTKNNVTSLFHRLVAEEVFGDVTGFDVHHKNGDRTDNRRENLELVTRSTNNFKEVRLRKNNTTGVRGVTYVARRGRYQVTWGKKYIGSYKTLEEAKLVRQELEQSLDTE